MNVHSGVRAGSAGIREPVISSAMDAPVADAMRRKHVRPDDVVLTIATLPGPALRLIQLSLDRFLPTPLIDMVDPLVGNARRALAA